MLVRPDRPPGHARIDHDPRVEGHREIGSNQERVDVELLDLGVVGDEIGESHQDLDQAVDVRARESPVPLEEGPRSERLEHSPGEPLVQRGKPRARSPKSSAATPPIPARITEPNVGSFFIPRMSSKPAFPVDHSLNGDALDPGFRPMPGGLLRDPGESGADRIGALDVEEDASDVGLVGDVGRENLQDDRVADFRGCRHRLLRGCRDPGPGDRNSVRFQKPLRNLFAERRPRGHCDRSELLAKRLSLGREDDLDVPGSFEQDVEIPRISHECHEGADGALGSRVGSDTGLVQQADPFTDAASAHPRRQDRFGAPRRQLPDGLRGSTRIGHRLRCQDHEGRIHARIAQHDLRRTGESLGTGIAENVDRVSPRPEGRQDLVELLDGLGG